MLLANATIMGMDEKNSTLLFGSGARAFDGLVLSVMDRRRFVATCGLNSPFALVRHNVLIGVGLLCRNLRRSDAFPVFDATMSLVNDEHRA